MDRKYIKRLRRKAGLSQWQVATRVGRSQTWLSRVELGQLVLEDEIGNRLAESIERISKEREELSREVVRGLKKYRDALEDRVSYGEFDRLLSSKLDAISVLLED
jgi:transcriptional regulator with XRE-family HTH domain